ncbi:LysR substrate-binding domain-containing protein [Candidatus Dactylopiibacterium carminicum]|uniref:LysR substrate-binding domain-containing protein n=1 Tax=Candidatus Dactylopiibacterium carminicum TaxID=857335 RepID=UPI001CC28DB0|nr:LysR substrate-binding domain-containing protein [Candidatus Dactylopiibacterium carminicum]
MTLNYAGEIFSLGAELQELLGSDQLDGLPTEYRVGINDALPNSIVQHLLAPLRMLDLPVRLLCREWEMQHLLAELGTHRLDLVLADTPIPVGFSVKAYSHRLGASPMAFFAAPPLAARCTALFPHCLHGLPFLLLTKESGVREQFEQWAHAQGLRPRIQAEFDDSGLMKTCGRAGWGVFMAPRVLAQEICRDYAVQMIGASAEIEQAYYAISVQRRITHPCTEAILRAAREGLFMLSGD